MPRPDLERAPAVLAALHRAIQAGLVAACHDLSEGGLAVAAAEMAFAGDLGIALDLALVRCADADGPGLDPDAVRLFSESCTRFLVEVAPEHERAFELVRADLPCVRLGNVIEEPVLRVRGVSGRPLFEVPTEDCRRAFHAGFRG